MDPLSISGTVAGLISVAQSLIPLLFRYVECLQSYPKEITELKNEIDRLRDVLCFYLPTVQKIEAGSRQAGTGQGIPDGALFDARCCRVSVAGTAGMPSTARRIRQLIGTVWSTKCKTRNEGTESSGLRFEERQQGKYAESIGKEQGGPYLIADGTFCVCILLMPI